MSLYNHITESYLQNFLPNITAKLWTGETDYSAQGLLAQNDVYDILSQMRYNPSELMPELFLRESNSISASETGEGVEDTISRLRLVIDNVTTTTSDKNIILQGSNDNSTWEDITTITTAENVTSYTARFYKAFTYYRTKVTILTGTLNYRAYLVETVYDNLFACKWLWWILFSMRKQDGDQIDIQMKELEKLFEFYLNKAVLYIDTDDDGEPDDVTDFSNVTMLK